MVILSTGYELYTKQMSMDSESDKIENSNNYHLFTSFSLIKNTKALFEKNKYFPALDTIRLLLILYVHLIHQYFIPVTRGIIGLKKLTREVLYKTMEDNRYVFLRNNQVLDGFITLRYT